MDSCELEISTLIEKIAEISRSLADPLFDAMKAAEAKKRALEVRQTFVRELIAQVQSWQAQAESRTLAALPEGSENDPELKAVQAGAGKARQEILDSLEALLRTLEGDNQVISAPITAWLPTFKQVEADYQALLASIGGNRRVKEQERKRLEDEKTSLDAEAGGYRELTAALPEILRARVRLLDELDRAYLRFYELRKGKFDHLTELSEGKLRLTLEHAADRSAYEVKLSDLLKGGANAPSVADRNRIAQNVLPRRLIQLVLDQDAVKLAEEAGITELWSGRAIEKLWSCPDFVEVLALQHNCYPADIPTIKFRKEGNQYDPLNELSVGQKCTALLIIALCDGNMPIVIDQPEDALDVISVWEDIAKQLRRGKNSRQFILTTHDSTVAVSADSDQFIVLRAGATSGKVVFAGAIDRDDVREAVIKHLEGGPEPYKLRSRKYNMQ